MYQITVRGLYLCICILYSRLRIHTTKSKVDLAIFILGLGKYIYSSLYISYVSKIKPCIWCNFSFTSQVWLLFRKIRSALNETSLLTSENGFICVRQKSSLTTFKNSINNLKQFLVILEFWSTAFMPEAILIVHLWVNLREHLCNCLKLIYDHEMKVTETKTMQSSWIPFHI